MKKVLVANISSKIIDNIIDINRKAEFELVELNKHLSEGWEIEKYDIVTNNIAYNFSIIYQLKKS